jgi:hypothetical protein
MTCEHCQELISAFLDNELETESSDNVRLHLSECSECSKVCEDLAMLINFSQLDVEESIVPPNPDALWCRINNIIESEVQAEISKENKEKIEPQVQTGWSWNFSFSQITSAVLGIALISSLLTFIGIRQYSVPTDDLAVQSEPTILDRALGKLGLIETPQQMRQRRIKEREAAIEYWNKRVQARREQWNANLRAAFDRNLTEINQAVNEYTQILQENPQDEISGEMLDSALNEKMDLLRQFSEL